jgi:hypothetical protein
MMMDVPSDDGTIVASTFASERRPTTKTSRWYAIALVVGVTQQASPTFA